MKSALLAVLLLFTAGACDDPLTARRKAEEEKARAAHEAELAAEKRARDAYEAKAKADRAQVDADKKRVEAAQQAEIERLRLEALRRLDEADRTGPAHGPDAKRKKSATTQCPPDNPLCTPP
jgi:hypothetical protein